MAAVQFAPRTLTLACAAALAVLVAGCKPDAPATDSAAPATTDATPAAAPVDAGPAATPAAPTPAPATLTEVQVAAPTPATTSGLCNIEALDDARFDTGAPVTVANPAAAHVVGWVGDDATRTRPAEPALRLTADDGRAWEIALGEPKSRVDVSKFYKAEGLSKAGFDHSVDLSGLPAGDYAVSVAYDRDGVRISCARGKPRIHIGT
jgi:hypothetical protein